MEIYNTNIYVDYEYVGVISKGSYGLVIEIVNKISKITYAAKKIRIPNKTEVSKTVCVELAVFNYLKYHPHKNLINILKIYFYKEDAYFVMHKYKYTLASYMNDYDLNESQKKIIMYQIAQGLAHLHLFNIGHYDLKPGNIIMNDMNDLVIIDFGLSVFITGRNDIFCGEETQTLTYRSPEMLFYNEIPVKYSLSSDIWSLGIIFHEIIYDKHCLEEHLNDHGNIGIAALKKLYKSFDLEKMPLVFLRKMFDMNPQKRSTIINVINDPYFSDCPFPSKIVRPVKIVFASKVVNWDQDIINCCLEKICFYGHRLKLNQSIIQYGYELIYLLSISSISCSSFKKDNCLQEKSIVKLVIIVLCISHKLYSPDDYPEIQYITEGIDSSISVIKLLELEKKIIIHLDCNLYPHSLYNLFWKKYSCEDPDSVSYLLYTIYHNSLRHKYEPDELISGLYNNENMKKIITDNLYTMQTIPEHYKNIIILQK